MCIHHWMIEPANGTKFSKGECCKCLETRMFISNFDPEDTEPPGLPVGTSAQHSAANVGIPEFMQTKKHKGAIKRREVAAVRG